jgi:hypothetical protein
VAAICFAIAIVFVWRSFYGMRIDTRGKGESAEAAAKPKPAE